LLIPPVRALARAWLLRGLLRQVDQQPGGATYGARQVKVRRGDPVPPGAGDVIEGEVVDPPPSDERPTA
jgi:UPF0716 family protein affecting phage T7 exclusion